VSIRLRASKLRPVEKEPETLGEHLRWARVSRGLTQKEAAFLLKVDAGTVLNWEQGTCCPAITLMPRILQFLGCDPFPEPQTLSERMLAKRREMGWTIREAAERLGVDPGTWARWERMGRVSWGTNREKIFAFLEV
jgi:transcriptional regulator with XRE-family HTH domain